MLVDPFTVFAQIVNFALLVWLLRRFLYGPVTRAMEAREARVREEMEAAKRLRAEAAAEGERYRALLAAFEAEREARLREVRAEADALRQELLRKARVEAKALRQRWSHALEQEKEAFLRALRAQVGKGSVEVIRNALKELADVDLEARLVDRFVARVRDMDEQERDRLVAAAQEDRGALRFRTAFPLDDVHREAIASLMRDIIALDSHPDFEVDTDLLAGIELRVGGLKVGWTLDDYLFALEVATREAFRETVPVGSHDEG